MTALDNLIAVGVLLALAILAYCKIADKTMVDLFKELKEILLGGEEDYE